MLYYWWCVWVAERRERVDKRKERGNGAAFEWQNCVQFNGATLSRFFSGHIGTNEGLTFFHINTRLRSQPCCILHLALRRKGPQLPNLYQPGRRKNGPSYEGQKEKLAQFYCFLLLLFSPCPWELSFFPTRDQIDDECYSVFDYPFLSITRKTCSHRHQCLSAV